MSKSIYTFPDGSWLGMRMVMDTVADVVYRQLGFTDKADVSIDLDDEIGACYSVTAMDDYEVNSAMWNVPHNLSKTARFHVGFNGELSPTSVDVACNESYVVKTFISRKGV